MLLKLKKDLAKLLWVSLLHNLSTDGGICTICLSDMHPHTVLLVFYLSDVEYHGCGSSIEFGGYISLMCHKAVAESLLLKKLKS